MCCRVPLHQKKPNIKNMTAIIVISVCFVLALVLRILESLTSSRKIKSVGANANRISKRIARFNINDDEDVLDIVEKYRDLID